MVKTDFEVENGQKIIQTSSNSSFFIFLDLKSIQKCIIILKNTGLGTWFGIAHTRKMIFKGQKCLIQSEKLQFMSLIIKKQTSKSL